MYSIYRFYKMNSDSKESLKRPMIYLFSTKKWEDDGEFDFEVDIGNYDDYKKFLRENLVAWFGLKVGDDGFEDFKKLRLSKLKEYDRLYLYEEIGEYAFL